MGDNVNTGDKGVFPTNGAKTEGNIAAAPAVAPAIATAPVVAPADMSHHEAVQPVQPVQENVTNATYAMVQIKNAEGEVSGIIESDLISFREKGYENRYLSIKTIGVGEDGNQSTTTITLAEEDFNIFKEFISKLNWND